MINITVNHIATENAKGRQISVLEQDFMEEKDIPSLGGERKFPKHDVGLVGIDIGARGPTHS